MVRKFFEIKGILRDYKAELRAHGIRVRKMVLYGSYARGNPKPYSDIDVVVISPDLAKFPALKRQEFLAKHTIPVDAPRLYARGTQQSQRQHLRANHP